MSPRLPITHIWLDLGHVLYQLRIAETFSLLAEACRDDAMTLQERIKESGLVISFDMGTLSETDFFAQLKTLMAYPDSVEELQELWNAMLVPIEENFAFARKLTAHYEVGIISNTNAAHVRQMEAHDKLSAFAKVRIYSNEIGFVKPRSEIFERALKLGKCSANRSLFIDDREENVLAARKLGFHTFLHQPDASLSTLWKETICPYFQSI